MKVPLLALSTIIVLSGCGSDGNNNEDLSDNISGGSSNEDLSDNISSNNNSLACYNPTLHEVGSFVDLSYQVSGDASFGYDVNEMVGGPVSYNGYNDVLTISEGSSTVYLKHDEDEQSVATLGEVDYDFKTTYEPNGITLNYNLNEGEKIDYSPVTVTETSEDGVMTYTLDSSFKYLGREQITIPSGTFDVCVFEHQIESIQSGATSNTLFTRYTGVGNGIMLKEITKVTSSTLSTTSMTTVLLSGSINGEALTSL
ncbi:hypothetical protein [Psychromonas aquatilis]|uniref:Lipoprotein n=1 Tax=Psychromonas aquatilis TaxID=2005072 RepID=A0ABU9GT61_9GAMM